jgi:hypothetical protein
LISAEKDEIDATQLWENQISDLKHLIDLYSKIVYYNLYRLKINLGLFL